MSKWRKIAIIALSLVLAIGIGGMLYSHLSSKNAIDQYDEALQLVELPRLKEESDPPVYVFLDPIITEDPTEADTQVDINDETSPLAPLPETPQEPIPTAEELYMQELAEMDISSLKAVNSDVLGWIVIPNTTISYPLLQGEDNQYYLKHTWKKKWNTAGAIYLDYRNSPQLNDFHSIIYGHRRRDETMFSPLLGYKENSFYQEHPFVYVLTDAGVARYAIFSAYYDKTSGNSWRLGLNDESGKQAFIDYCLDKSLLSTQVVPTVEDSILTLSTCSGLGDDTMRWVVHAVLIKE